MMTCRCSLCGKEIRADRAPMLLNPGDDPTTAFAIAEISEFDLMAGRMSAHLEAHSPQFLEMAAVSHLASKVYAMTWADQPSEPNFEQLRQSWRTGILQMMQKTTEPARLYDGDGAEAPAEASETSPADGSKVKKSERNASN